MPKDARGAFLSVFSKVVGTGNFHSTGASAFFLPEIRIEGVEELAFPLPEAQALVLAAAAEAAPFGKGEKTEFDEGVRKCRQIDAARISIKSPQWKNLLKETLDRVREDLGIPGKISAIPYKLLIYGPGGHFLPHRDTEKLEAMFGTLIIALPSAHEGGELVIRHGGREGEVNFSRGEHRNEFQYAAFFADCEHEVKPVRSGWRCCLVYNLRLDQGDVAMLNQASDKQAQILLPSLKALAKERSGELTAVLLEHAYTEANCSWRNLKGNDRARARALLAAAAQAGLTAHLGLVTYHQLGQLEDAGYGYDDDPEDGTMGEIIEDGFSISAWRDAQDRRVALGEYQIDDQSLISEEALGDGEPDEQEAEGYTGNAGCTIEYWYRRAAVVFWAEEDHEAILCDQDFAGACRTLAALAKRKNTGGPFQRLAAEVIRRYPEALPHESLFHRQRLLGEDPFAMTLEALAAARDRDLARDLIGKVPAGAFGLCDTAGWARLFKAFGTEMFDPVFETLTAADADANRAILFQVLEALVRRKKDSPWGAALAETLSALAPAPPEKSWERKRDPVPPGNRDETRVLLLASHLLQSEKVRGSALSFLRADASPAYVRDVLGPVLLEPAVEKARGVKGSLIPELRTFAMKVLADEIARPLEPYPDWTRPCPDDLESTRSHGFGILGASHSRRERGEVERELAAFLADPATDSHDFVRNQGERQMIEDWIRDHFLDLDHTTIQRGRPYTLRCTKNDNSHKHALKIRAKDRELLKKLKAR